MTMRRRKKHRPEEVVAKLRDADAMLNAGKESFAVLPGLRQVAKQRLVEFIRDAPADWMRRLDEALTLYLAE